MNRFAFHSALALALLGAATASAADGLLTNLTTAEQPVRLEAYSWQNTSIVEQPATSALAQRFNSPDHQVSEFITVTTNRVFGAPVAVERDSQLAALVHPLGSPVQTALRPTMDLNPVRATVFTSTRSPAILKPVTFGASPSLLSPADPALATTGAISFQIR